MNTLENKSALVTGGAGFIGSHVVEALVDEGVQVTILDNRARLEHPNLEHVRGNVQLVTTETETALHNGLLEAGKFDYIFHLSGNAYVPASVENPALDFQKNVQADRKSVV